MLRPARRCLYESPTPRSSDQAAQPATVLVAGLGAMGSAAAYHLARRGWRVIGFDRFRPPHPWGSTTGESRIIRQAYFESPAYVPLVQAAYHLWQALAQEANRPLLRTTGGLMLGQAESDLIRGSLESARLHRLAHTLLTHAEIGRLYPAFRLDEDWVGVFEPDAGSLDPEAAVAAHLAGAKLAGAELFTDTEIVSWRKDGSGVILETTQGRFTGDHLVLALGPWMPEPMGMPALPLTVTRQIQFWFVAKGDGAAFLPDRLPVYLVEEPGPPMVRFYGFPDFGRGAKAAIHHDGQRTDPTDVQREARREDIANLRRLLARRLPGLDVEPVRSAVCLYTNTPDEHFVLGSHPEHPEVTLVSACSGHGFKFAPAIGWVVAHLAEGLSPPVEIELFRPDRWGWPPDLASRDMTHPEATSGSPSQG